MTILYYQHSTGYTPIKDLLEKCKWSSLAFGDLIVTNDKDGIDLFYVNKEVGESDIVNDYTHVFHCDDNKFPMEKSGVIFAFDHSHKRRGYRKALQWMAAAADTDIIEDIFDDAIRILDYKEERLDANDTMRFMRFCQELKNPEIGKSIVSVEYSDKPKVKIVEKVVEKIVEVPVEKIKEIDGNSSAENIVDSEKQLKYFIDSLLMEYKRLGAKAQDIKLLLNAVSNSRRLIGLSNLVIATPLSTVNKNKSVLHSMNKETRSITSKDNVFLEEITKVLNRSNVTYKPLWLCAIAMSIKEDNNFTIPANELAMRFLAIAWDKKECAFPPVDKVPFWQRAIINGITNIKKYSKYVDILKCIRIHKETPEILSVLENIYNSTMSSFLKTWINSSSNTYIISKSKQLPNHCIYSIENLKGQVYININPVWRDFLENETQNVYDLAYRKFELILERNDCKDGTKPQNSIITSDKDVNAIIATNPIIDDLQKSNENIGQRSFEEYVKLFSELNVKSVNGYIEPHKAVLIYAILVLLGRGYYKSNIIIIDKELERMFEDIWYNEIGIHPVFKCKIEQAFTGLENEPFWILKKARGWIRKNSYSVNDLKKYYKGGEFTPDLFEYIQDEDKRDKLISILKSQYIKKKNV